MTFFKLEESTLLVRDLSTMLFIPLTREIVGDGTFSSTSDYFKYVIEQDWEQLVRQPNSAYGPFDAADRYQMF